MTPTCYLAAGSGSFGSTSLFGTTSAFGGVNSVIKNADGPPPATTGTSIPAYSATRENEADQRTPSLFQDITAMRAYQGTSSEELRAQDYQQGRKAADAFGQVSSGVPIPKTSEMFGKPSTTQQSAAASSVFGSGSTSAFGTTTNQPATSPFGAFEQQQSDAGTTSAFGQPKPATGFGSTFRQPTSAISDSSKAERIDEFLTKSLLGEELVNTQFHLFSARSPRSGRVLEPRVLCANNVLLTKESKYFLDLLSSDINPSDPSLIDLMGDDDIPSSADIDDYGYESDSDLDDCDDDPIPAADTDAPKGHSATLSIFPYKAGAETAPKDGDKSPDDGFESVGSDISTSGTEQPRTDESLSEIKDEAASVTSDETAAQEIVGDKKLADQIAARLRSLRSRHILVKDTAFQTWYTLLKYLYTGRLGFLPLSSAPSAGQPQSLPSFLDGPRCSAKSMYRLASKVGLDCLRDQALAHIRSNLTEQNILEELSCSLVSKYPQLLEMELDVLYLHITSPPVVAGFATLSRRVANKEFPHGADIMIGIHARLLKERHPFLSQSGALTPRPSVSPSPKQAALAVDAIEIAEAAHETGPSDAENQGTQSGALRWGGSESSPSVPPEASATMAMPAVPSTKEQSMGGKKKGSGKRK